MLNYRAVKTIIKVSAILTLSIIFVSPSMAWGQWTRLNNSLPGQHIEVLALDPSNQEVLYAGGEGRLYRSRDNGQSWKAILKLKSPESMVRVIKTDASLSGLIAAGTDEGVYLSRDNGRKWERVFRRYEAAEEKVNDLHFNFASSRTFLVGTDAGLYVSDNGGKTWQVVPEFRDIPVFQVAQAKESGSYVMAAVTGIFTSNQVTGGWRQIYHAASRPTELPAGNAEAVIEETLLAADFVSFKILDDAAQDLWVIHGRDVIQSQDGGRTWDRTSVQALPSEAVDHPAFLRGNGQKAVIPTQKGLFLHNHQTNETRKINWGLPSGRIRDVVYNTYENSLITATDQGIYRLAHPEISIFLQAREGASKSEWASLMSHFAHEPGIRKLHEVAMDYAEVHPNKIKAWRRQAALKAWVPSVSFGFDQGRDETVEIDRGGTNDPDTFIIGPEESDMSWSIDFGWDLSELIWNPDQTSIDVRSKLMVQLRDDILNELNHLYFARRRLQIETLLAPSPDLETAIERQLQIEEYTAGIDALTGGYLSRAIGVKLGDQGADF